MSLITLTTDFGHEDSYVGQVKGAILSVDPAAVVVDFCHAVPPQDVLAAALMLEQAMGVFPKGAIHLAVVDPGVGTERAPIAVQTSEGFLVGPDNGIFTAVLEEWPLRRAVRLSNRRYHRRLPSATFHGRDIFGPVAAYLGKQVEIEKLGDPHCELVMLDLPHPQEVNDALLLHVIAVDRFGNLITDLKDARYRQWLKQTRDEAVQITVGGASLRGVRKTYANVDTGRLVAYLGSGGRLEIAVRNGSAAKELGLHRGAAVTLQRS